MTPQTTLRILSASIIAAFYISVSIGQTTVVWTGATDDDWNTASNWSPMSVPTGDNAGDSVVIVSATNNPVIKAGIMAYARVVTIQQNAKLTIEATGSLTVENSASTGVTNNGEIINSGTVLIDSSYMHGLENAPTGIVINNGSFTIIEGKGNRLRNSGTIINSASQTFDVRGGLGVGAINYPDAIIDNSGAFNVSGGDSTLMINHSIIMNKIGASFTINGNSNGSGLNNEFNGKITNEGTFTISQGLTNLINKSIVENRSGATFTVGGGGNSRGIVNHIGSTLTNNGNFVVQGNAGPGSDTMVVNHAMITNTDGATFTVQNFPGIGLINFISGIIINSGELSVRGGAGIMLLNYGRVDSDSLMIQYSASKGIVNEEDGIMNIRGYTLLIGFGSDVLTNKGKLHIHPGAEVRLSNTNSYFILNEFGASIFNEGKLIIGSNGNDAIENNGVFNNSATAEIEINSGGGNHIDNNHVFTAAAGSSIVFNGSRSTFITNEMGDSLILNGNVTFPGCCIPTAINNNGYCEFFAGDQNFNSTNNFIANEANGEFLTKGNFSFTNVNNPITNKGKMTIQMTSHIRAKMVNAIIDNQAGATLISYASIADTSGGYIRNGGLYTNMAGADMDFSQGSSSGGGALVNLNGATFNNHATLKIRQMGTSLLLNEGNFINHSDGAIDLGYGGKNGIENSSNGIFDNQGMIQINKSGIDSIRNNGILNNGMFSNQNMIEIGQMSRFPGDDGEAITNTGAGVFMNLACGLIDVFQDNLILDLNASFTNNGIIIENGVGGSNINLNNSGGMVINQNGGTFSITTNNGSLVNSAAAPVCTDCTTPPMGLLTCAKIGNVNSNEPTGFDPCSCSDIHNVRNPDRTVQLFHEYVQIEDLLNRTWRLHSVTSGNVLDNTGSALPEGVSGAVLIGTDIDGTPLPSNTTRLDFYHIPSTGYSAVFSPDGGVTTLTFSNSCAQCAAEPIPTLGEWGLISLGFILLIVGVVGVRQRIIIAIKL